MMIIFNMIQFKIKNLFLISQAKCLFPFPSNLPYLGNKIQAHELVWHLDISSPFF